MESPESPSPGGLLELRATATKLIRGVDELFPKQHIEKALSKVEQITPRDCEDDDVELLRRPPEWRKRKLRAECRLLQQQLQEKKASEEAFLKNMMTFFKDEDGKSIALRMQIQDLVDQYEELNKHCEQQELEAEALQACLQLMAAYAEDAKQRNTFLIETLTQLLSNQPTIIPGEHNELSRAWQECVLAAYHRLSNDFGTCTDNMLCRRNMFLDRLEDAKRENKEHALQMALLMQTTTQAREKLDGFKRRYFWDSSSESLKDPRVPKLPLADTPELEPPSLVRKDPDHFLEDVPELSEDISPQSSKSREKQPEQEPDCIQVPAGLHSASHDQPMQCQRHLHSLLPQAVPTQHHRMCSPPRIPVYTQATAQNAQPQPVGWQFRSRPLVHGPCHGPCIAEPSAVPKMRVSVSPPRLVAAPPYVHSSHSAPSAPGARSAQLLGASCRVPVGWCSGASIRVPSPVPEGVRAEPRWRNTLAPNVPSAPGPPKRGSCPCPLSERGQLWRMARSPRASHPPALRPATYRSEWRMTSPDAGRATVPTYVSPCQFSPRRPTRSPSPQRFQASTPRAVSPIIVRSPITYHIHRGSAPGRASKERASRTPSPCAPVFTSGQPLRVAALPPQVGVTDSGCGSCQVPPSFIGMSWELPSGRSPPAPRPAPRPVPHVPLQTPLPAPPVLRVPLRSPSPVDLGHTPRGRAEPSAWPPLNHVFRHFSPLSRSIQAPNRPMEPRA